MNYYPFHIGDYVCATRHLSWEEDAAYRRLLDTYYTTEKPLPLDEKKIFRLVLASSKTQREAVLTVLEEFFSCTDGGWVNERAQKEIEEMRVKQSDIEKKNAHETERMRRYRERRAAMFEALRTLGIVPAWDVSMTELQRLFDTHCNANGNAPATHLQREQVVFGDAPATAIPTPTPTPTPTPIKDTKEEKKVEKKESQQAAGAAPPDFLPKHSTQSQPTPKPDPAKPKPQAIAKPDSVAEAVWLDWLALRKAKKAAVTATVLAQAESEATKAGMSLNDFFAEWCLRGSQGLKAEWLLGDRGRQGGFAKPQGGTVNGVGVSATTIANVQAAQEYMRKKGKVFHAEIGSLPSGETAKRSDEVIDV